MSNHQNDTVVDRSDPAVDSFRLLVVDDERDIQDHARDLFKEDADVHVISAYTQAEGIAAIDDYCLDAAIVDIELDPIPAGGYEVLRKFAMSAPNVPLVVYTQYVDPAHIRDLLDLVNLTPPRIVSIVEKGPLGSRSYDPRRLRSPLSDILSDWRKSKVAISNRDLALQLLAERAGRIKGYRESETEVAAELDRICRTLFGKVRGLADGAEIGIQLSPIGPEGLSSAITVEAKVILGDDVSGKPVTGSRCVLKIGPVADIREEVDRYAQFVKYGVRLKQRVELLGDTYEHALGAVCYSFAGGVFGSELQSLSKLLESPVDRDLAREAISALFDVSSQNWYAVQCDKESALGYVARTYNTNFGACYDRLDKSLTKLLRKLRGAKFHELVGGDVGYSRAGEDVDGSFEIGGRKLLIPKMNVLGGGKFVAAIPACLVHGDMHGSNVMLELEGTNGNGNGNGHGNGTATEGNLRRVCLIDYRSAGPGPRSTDAIALQASLRLADAKQIVIDVSGDTDVSALSDEQLAEAVTTAARRDVAEARLIAAIESGADGDPPDGLPHWEAMDLEITSAMRRNFADISVIEYLSAALPIALRYFGYSLGPIARVRMLAWVSAQLQVMRQATAEMRIPPNE